MPGDQLVDEPGEAVELALRGAALEDDGLTVDIAALGKVAHHPGAEYPGVGRADADQPDAIDFARLGERAGWQHCDCGSGDDASEESHRITLALVAAVRDVAAALRSAPRPHPALLCEWGRVRAGVAKE